MQKRTYKSIGLWIVTLIPVVIFLMAGATKLLALEPHVVHYERWGYPHWFMFLVGATEFVGALLLLYPRVATVGAAALGLIMVGAIFTHLTAGEYMMSLIPLGLSGILYFIGRERLELFLEEFEYPHEQERFIGNGAHTHP